MSMRKIIVFLLVFTFFSTLSQEQISEYGLIGEWKITVDVGKAVEEIEEESETILEEIIAGSLSEIVKFMMDNIKLYIQFKKGGDVIVYADAYELYSKEVDYFRWYIRENKLYIEDTRNNDRNWSNDDEWEMKGGKLVLENDDMIISMVKVQ